MIKTSRIVTQTTPWYNKAEFVEVYRCLFSRDIFDMRWAVDRIRAWETRCEPVLDIGIDATAAIVRALIQDKLVEANTSLCQPADLQLMYSVALIRFINVISEIARTRWSTVPVRVASLKLGIPEWIVHLRNNASHSRVPSLMELRNGSLVALDWLQVNYWEKEVSQFADYIKVNALTDPKASEAKANLLIVKFQTCQYERLYQKVPQHIYSRKLNEILNTMRMLLRKKPKSLLTELLKPGLFLPSVHDLHKILDINDESFFIEKTTIDLPSSLQGFWVPVVKLIIMENCIQEFVELLLQNQNKRDPLHQKVAACWVHKLIQDEENESLFRDDFEEERQSFNWVRLLGICLEHCCMYTPALLPIMADNVRPPLSSKKKNFIMALVAVYLGATTTPNGSDERSFRAYKTFSVDTLKEDLNIRDSEHYDGNVFHEVPETVDWASSPLGCVFGSEPSFTINVPPLPDYEEMVTDVPNEKPVESEKQCLEIKEDSRPINNEQNEITENGNTEDMSLEYYPDRLQVFSCDVAKL